MSAREDMRHLWATRKSCGFPWPFQLLGSRRQRVRMLITGYPFYSPVPLWRQVLRIPLRPVRYARMVRAIAWTRNRRYSPSMQDDVP